MKLDRNTNETGQGKYALIKLRGNLPLPFNPDGSVIVNEDTIDFGDTDDSEFFVIRLKDKYAGEALRAYAVAAELDGEKEWANEVYSLVNKAQKHKSKKMPD